MMTMTVDLYSAQYPWYCSQRSGVVTETAERGKVQRRQKTNLDAGDVGLSIQQWAEKSPGRVFRCLRKTIEEHILAGCGRAFQSLGAELDTALQPSIRHSVSSVINT